MLSISNDVPADIGDRIMAAAASCVRDFGVERVALAEIARRAGVSRPTVYRRWPDLPLNARRYVERLAELAQTPVRFVSVGPHRDALIVV